MQLRNKTPKRRVKAKLREDRAEAVGPNDVWAMDQIDTYTRLKGWPLSESHISMLRAMDDAWLDHAHSKQGGGQGTVRQSAGQKINPAAFDAVFG